jgi:hypothetical protein
LRKLGAVAPSRSKLPDLPPARPDHDVREPRLDRGRVSTGLPTTSRPCSGCEDQWWRHRIRDRTAGPRSSCCDRRLRNAVSALATARVNALRWWCSSADHQHLSYSRSSLKLPGSPATIR